MKTRLRRAFAMIALIAFVVTMLPLSAFAEARTSFIRSRIDSRPARPDSGIEIVPHKTENPKRSAIWDGSIAAGFAGGSGTEDDPYLISNGSELAYLAQQVNSGNRYENVHFKLTNDIYLNDTTDWELWGTTGSSSTGKADTRDEVIEPTEQNKSDKMDVPIAIPVRPAPKTELESDTLSDALNAAGQSNTFVSTGSYPWLVDSTTYDGRTAAQSGNHNVSSSTSSFSTTVTLSAGDIVSFEYCVSSESNYDEFEFSVNDSVVLTKSGLVSWNSYSYQATADGEYTFMWSYAKDSSANGNSDACWVDNVYIGAPLAVTGIDVLEHLDIPVNGTGTVAYSVLPENAYNKNVSFESADAGIAAVNANGVVTGVSAGETTITVTTEDGGFTGACTINVYNQAVTGVTIEPSEAELTVGSSTKLTATVLPENASNKNVIYSVDDESILSVDQDGNVTGLSLGTATVTVTTEDGGFTASSEITVIPVRVTGVGISPEAASIGIGHTIQLTASITPSNAANKNLSWSVSDETIISVDGQGTVTGLSGGTATVTVTTEDGGFTASAEITVCYAPANTWTAIGTMNGVFNGDGYAVRGIYINTQESYQGLFGISYSGSIIANLGVAESYIYGGLYVGGVVGYSYKRSTVTNCYNTGSVIGEERVGGVIGYATTTNVTNCYNTGSVNGEKHVGGVVGYSRSAYNGSTTVANCYNTGSITGSNYVGGVVGYNTGDSNNGTVIDCCNAGSITGEEDVGGVVGSSNCTVTNCYNTGEVTGIGYGRVGGVVGSDSGTVTDCYNTGSVNGEERVGGVVGHGLTITDCYNEGSITGKDDVGGVVGCNAYSNYNGTVTNCYNIGIVNGHERVGGVVGYNESGTTTTTVTSCYNTGSITGSNYVGGVVGYNSSNSHVTDCHNTSSITGGNYVGGVVGYNGNNGTITNCYNVGSVTGNYYIGGVVGYGVGDTVTNCYNTGSVTGNYYIGGVVGDNLGSVTNCYNMGSVSSTDDHVGGVAGYVERDGTVTNCYNTGRVSGFQHVGGVVGGVDENYSGTDKITNCYYYDRCCFGSNSYGTALTLEQMTHAESFVGFDFETVWTMNGTQCYPYPKLISNFQTVGNMGNWDGSIATDFALGRGIASDPYLIFNGAELAYLAQQVNSGTSYSDTYFKLTNDIWLNDTSHWESWGENTAPSNSWTAIGTPDNCFEGHFDGGGYAVHGVYINKPETDYQGLFGYAEHATISNLGVVESYVKGNNRVGGVVGYYLESSYSSVNGCYNEGTVTGDSLVGGVVGRVYNGTVSNCHNTGKVSGNESVGGVVGRVYNQSTVTNCYNTGKVSGNEFVGGVVGAANDGDDFGDYKGTTVTDCYNIGVVSGDNIVGGVVGINENERQTGYVLNCYNIGVVSGDSKVGGVVGENYSYYGAALVNKCYNTGSVIGNGYVGGVVGRNYAESYGSGGNSRVLNCYNIGSVIGNGYVGGVVSYNSNFGDVTKCYNIGNVTGASRVGGVVDYSYNSGDVINCYYNIGCCTSSNSYGIALTNEQMLRAESFEGFDFETVWTMDGNPGYPYPKLVNNFQTAVPYMVIHNIGIKGGTYTADKIEVFFGEPGTTVSALPIEIPGYTFDETVEGTCMSGVVAEDGSLELALFYNDDGMEQLPEIDITKKSIYVVETGTLYPVKSAKVTVRTADGYEIEAISNFLGLVEVSVPDSSSYTIAISCEGYCPKSLENVILKNGEFYEAALSKIDYSAPLGGSVEVTYTDANTTAPLDILAATKRLNSEEENFEFTITAKSFSDLMDGQYELLQDGDVIKTSTDGVFKLKVSDLKPDIPLWIRIRDDGKYCKPAKLGLSTYTGVFGLHDGDEVKLMDKLELPIPSDIPFLGGSVISLDLGYIPVKVKSKGDTVRIGLGTDNLFDPEDKDMWEKLKESVRKGAAAYGATAFGTVDLGGKVKPDLKIIGFAEGKITAHGLEVISGEMIIQAKIKYEHEWQTFAWVIPIVIKVGVGLELENTLEIDWENGLKVNDRVELTIPNLKPKAGIGIAYVADVSVYGKAENVLGFDTKTNYYFGELKGEAGLSAKVLLWEGKWCLVSGQWRYAEGYLKSGHSFDEMSYSLISRDYLKEQSGWLGDNPAKYAVGAKQTSVLQENVLSIASPMLANVNGKLIAVWIADDGSRATGNHSQLVYSLYNEADNTWSAPAAVWNDGTADFTPQMVSDGTNAYVVWADANTVFDENVTTEQMAAACEISYAKLSVDENGNVTVSQQRRLTENSSLDFQPSVAVDANGVHIAWIRNAANDLLAQSGTNAIMYCTETGSETELHSLATPISSLAIGCMNGNVCVAYCSDEDGDAATADDVKTYFGTVGGSFAAITEGASNSSTVSFMRFGSEGNKLFFMNNSILCSYDGNAIKQYDSVTEPGNDYSIINDGSNTTYLLYNANNGDNSQLYLRIYDPSNDTWKQPIALTNTPGYAENFSAAVLGTKVVAMFTRSDVTMAADSMETSTDLYAVVMTPAHDLCLSDVAYDSDSITLGGTLPISLTVKNNGELDETGVVVTVSANGVETQSFTIDTLLNSGDTKQVSIEYVLPNTAAVTEFTFSVTSSSGEEILLDDNSIAKELFLADLSIDVHKLMSDSVSTVLVPVSNIGFVDTNATLYIRRDTEDGEILAQFDMGVIHAGMMQVMEFYDAYIKSLMEGSSSLCFSVVADNDEYMIANNSNFISVTEIDLSDSQYKFAVTFVNMDGEVLSTQNIAYGDAAVAPEAPAMEGYIFIGWDKEFGCITDTMTVTARYAIARTVTFVDWDGTVLSTQVVADGNSATAPEVPEREGYTFTGWDVEFTSVTENITVTAQYDIKKYSVVFCDWDGSIISEQVVEHGEAAIAPPDPAREGLNFTGWSIDFSIITSDCFIYAVYAPIANSGDANGDGTVNAVDALVAMRYVLGVSTENLTPEQIAAADFNGDGAVNAVDTLLIMRFSLGLIEAVVKEPVQDA